MWRTNISIVNFKQALFSFFLFFQVLVKRSEELLPFLQYPGEEKMASITTLGPTTSSFLPISQLRSLLFDHMHVDHVRIAKEGKKRTFSLVEFTSCGSAAGNWGSARSQNCLYCGTTVFWRKCFLYF